MVRRAHVLHYFLVVFGRARHGRFVLFRRHLRQLLDEGHHVPYELVVVGLPPGGHCRQLNSMFDDPELLGWCQVIATGELRCRRI